MVKIIPSNRAEENVVFNLQLKNIYQFSITSGETCSTAGEQLGQTDLCFFSVFTENREGEDNVS